MLNFVLIRKKSIAHVKLFGLLHPQSGVKVNPGLSWRQQSDILLLVQNPSDMPNTFKEAQKALNCLAYAQTEVTDGPLSIALAGQSSHLCTKKPPDCYGIYEIARKLALVSSVDMRQGCLPWMVCLP